MPEQVDPREARQQIDVQLSHVWMVRAFLKHSDEAEEDEDVQQVHRTLYDFMLAVGGKLGDEEADDYLKQAHKKFRKLREACELFLEIQPEVSSHTNFHMAARSLQAAVTEIARILGERPPALPS
jgi:cob(I)alamin adenosyltransferase